MKSDLLRIACVDTLEQAERTTADLVVLPELADGGYAALREGRGIHTPGDSFCARLAARSRACRLGVVAGIALAGKKHATNTALFFAGGRLRGRYDKIHLFPSTGDRRWFSPGSTAGVFPARGNRGTIRLGMMLCFDLRFPELARKLCLEGMTVLVVPARWPSVRRDPWLSLLKARAIENQVFVIGCNARGKEGGPSAVFDPMGRKVRMVRGVAELDLGVCEEAKRLYDARRETRLRITAARRG